MPLGTGRPAPPRGNRQADRALIATVVTVTIKTIGQILQVWIKGGGRVWH
jgi:hypothetical protein